MRWIAAAVAVLAAAAGLALERSRSPRRAAREARELLAGGAGAAPPAAPEGLPPPVRRYLTASGVLRRAAPRGVHLRHGGTFRPGLDRPWHPIRGEQWLSTDPPGFVWWGRIRTPGGLWVDARDRSVRGEGEMLVKLASRFTLQRARGRGLDGGALLRLLGELLWMPSALFDGRYVRWEPLDDASARATLAVGGRSVTATFTFGPDGLPLAVEGLRQRDLGRGRTALTPFRGESSDFREVEGLRVPFRMEAVWIVGGEPFPYARFEVERLAFDPP